MIRLGDGIFWSVFMLIMLAYFGEPSLYEAIVRYVDAASGCKP